MSNVSRKTCPIKSIGHDLRSNRRRLYFKIYQSIHTAFALLLSLYLILLVMQLIHLEGLDKEPHTDKNGDLYERIGMVIVYMIPIYLKVLIG